MGTAHHPHGSGSRQVPGVVGGVEEEFVASSPAQGIPGIDRRRGEHQPFAHGAKALSARKKMLKNHVFPVV